MVAKNISQPTNNKKMTSKFENLKTLVRKHVVCNGPKTHFINLHKAQIGLLILCLKLRYNYIVNFKILALRITKFQM